MGLSFLNNSEIFAGSKGSEGKEETDWRIDFMRTRFHDLINILNSGLDKEILIPMLHQLGSKCGEGFAKDFKNNPRGFFTFIKERWADTVDYDEGNGIIRVNEKVRNSCNCPLVKDKEAPDILCNCSIGTQKKIYESLFGRQVNVKLEKSILRGDERCSFTIKLL
jgi:predicted hydrocarbon binding protein